MASEIGHDDGNGRQSGSRSALTTVTLLAAALAALVIAVLCTALFPGPLPTPRDPHFVDVVFDNRSVVWAARLLLVSGAFVLAVGGAYILSSTVVHMKNGAWLKRAGPFEVSETALADLEAQVRFWRSAALDDEAEIEDLRVRLDEAVTAIERLKSARGNDMV